MDKIRYLIALGACCAWLSVPAQAVTVSSSLGPFSAGALNTNNDNITFEGIPVPNIYPGTLIKTGTVPGSIAGVTITTAGTAFIANNAVGTAAGISATPFNDLTNYLSLLNNASALLTFGQAHTGFGLYWGSIDAYNHIEFLLGNTSVSTFSGNTLNAVPPVGFNGNQTSLNTNAYITFTDLAFDQVRLWSTGNSFEFDNISFSATTPQNQNGVPELSTWAMIIFGFAGVGFMGYRRTRKNDAPFVVA
jgi:hypothetical protein